jgi:hypothetical protein
MRNRNGLVYDHREPAAHAIERMTQQLRGSIFGDDNELTEAPSKVDQILSRQREAARRLELQEIQAQELAKQSDKLKKLTLPRQSSQPEEPEFDPMIPRRRLDL